MNLTNLIEPLSELAQLAGNAILKIYYSDFDVLEKDDTSPLTQADLNAHHIIIDGLKIITPNIPIISEETPLQSFEERKKWQRYWIIDPLDGTKEFVKKNGEFTVNIALIENHKTVLGVVYVPVSMKTYIGCEGFGAQIINRDNSKKIIRVTEHPNQKLRIVGSRSHQGDTLKSFLSQIDDYELKPMGSSLKFCLIAEGLADIYPRYGPTSEWDTAAAQAIVEQAGGMVLTTDGQPLLYNTKDNILNPNFAVINSIKLKKLFVKND